MRTDDRLKQGGEEHWAGWGLGPGRGARGGGCSLGPSGGGLPSSPRQRGFLLQSKPRLCRPGAGARA